MLLPFRANQEYGALIMTHRLSRSLRTCILQGGGGMGDDAERGGV